MKAKNPPINGTELFGRQSFFCILLSKNIDETDEQKIHEKITNILKALDGRQKYSCEVVKGERQKNNKIWRQRKDSHEKEREEGKITSAARAFLHHVSVVCS